MGMGMLFLLTLALGLVILLIINKYRNITSDLERQIKNTEDSKEALYQLYLDARSKYETVLKDIDNPIKDLITQLDYIFETGIRLISMDEQLMVRAINIKNTYEVLKQLYAELIKARENDKVESTGEYLVIYNYLNSIKSAIDNLIKNYIEYK